MAKSTQIYQDWLFSDERNQGMSFSEWMNKGLYSPVVVDTDCFPCRGTGEGMTEYNACYFCRGRGYIIPDYKDYE